MAGRDESEGDERGGFKLPLARDNGSERHVDLVPMNGH
jgi:hypothetical protein